MDVKRMRVPDFAARKRQGEKIVMLTAYDATMARLLDRAGVDAILVGDSLGTVILGLETTLPVTLDAVVHHTRAVVRGAERAFVIADMPFLTFQVGVGEAVRNAGRLLQEGGAAAVKLEGGRPVADVVKRLVDVGIPVMGHLGLQPQSVHQAGGYVKQATKPAAVDALMIDALALQDAGAFSLVLESIPADVARTVTQELAIPTIGIGAGPDCDGQILVSYDMLGLFDGFVPSFVHQYAKLGDAVVAATREYASDVRAGRYPHRANPVAAGAPTTSQ
jgi:3-methyl-2-oxobutanoate hydroxymethyltransferase